VPLQPFHDGLLDDSGAAFAVSLGSIVGGALGRRGCTGHSFIPDTPVLMADGSTKPIKDVAVGDQVASTDPATGESSARPVTALHINDDTDLTDLTIVSAAAGTENAAVGVIHTTAHHPIYDKDGSDVDARRQPSTRPPAAYAGHRGPEAISATVVRRAGTLGVRHAWHEPGFHDSSAVDVYRNEEHVEIVAWRESLRANESIEAFGLNALTV